MNTFYIVVMIALMIEIPAVILYRTARDAALPFKELTHGRHLIGSCGIIVFGALLGAEAPTFGAVLFGLVNEFAHTHFFVPSVGPAATLLNLVAILVFARLTSEGVDASMRLIRGPKNAEAAP